MQKCTSLVLAETEDEIFKLINESCMHLASCYVCVSIELEERDSGCRSSSVGGSFPRPLNVYVPIEVDYSLV